MNIFIAIFGIGGFNFFSMHVFFYKYSSKDAKVFEYGKLYTGWFIRREIFFPVSIKFKDDEITRKCKRKSNKYLYLFYVCVFAVVILEMFNQN
jgi:hypothetical protein